MVQRKDKNLPTSNAQAQIITGRDGEPAYVMTPIETFMALSALAQAGQKFLEDVPNSSKVDNIMSKMPPDFFDKIYENIRKIDDARDEDGDIAAYDAAIRRDEESFPSEVADRLIAGDSPVKVFRKFRRMTQGELAAETGTSAAYLSQIETGRRTGSVKLLSRLASALGVEIDDLV